jgi:AbrB family looped-hinge helix DNA binding protein
MITTVTGKNQITIPAELAREFDIAPGTRLDWAKGGEGLPLLSEAEKHQLRIMRDSGRKGRFEQESLGPPRLAWPFYAA